MSKLTSTQKSIQKNQQRAARNKLIWHLKHVIGIKMNPNNPLSINEAVNLFAEHYHITINGNSKKWLYKIYTDGEDEILGRKYDNFYTSPEWRQLRKKIINKFGNRCMKCGIEDDNICVDHIKPKSKYPELQMDENNLQILCRICNSIKSNKNEIDYRNKIL